MRFFPRDAGKMAVSNGLGEHRGLLVSVPLALRGGVQSLQTSIAKTFARFRGHLGPPGRKLEIESENEFPGPLGPRAQKVEKRVEKESKSTVFQLF